MPAETVTSVSGEFLIKDCALIAIASGTRVYSLTELRDSLATARGDSIYYHFWGALLNPRFEEREFNNDFASWVRHGLHDGVLAERLAMVDPTNFGDTEELRRELQELVEERLDESEYLRWLRTTRPFEFTRSQIVVFDTNKRAQCPEDLADLMPNLSTGSIFYHFIDAMGRSAERKDDFRTWLEIFGDDYAPVRERLAQVDPYFGPLTAVRKQLAAIFSSLRRDARE